MKPILVVILAITICLALEADLQLVDSFECKPETCAATSCVPAPKTCSKGYKLGPGGICGCCQTCLKVQREYISNSVKSQC